MWTGLHTIFTLYMYPHVFDLWGFQIDCIRNPAPFFPVWHVEVLLWNTITCFIFFLENRRLSLGRESTFDLIGTKLCIWGLPPLWLALHELGRPVPLYHCAWDFISAICCDWPVSFLLTLNEHFNHIEESKEDKQATKDSPPSRGPSGMTNPEPSRLPRSNRGSQRCRVRATHVWKPTPELCSPALLAKLLQVSFLFTKH